MKLLISILLFFTAALTAQQVDVMFTITDSMGGEQIIKAGVDPSATDGLDAELEEAELPPLPPTGIFDARFVLPDPSDGTVASLKDYRYGDIIPSNEGFITQHKLTSQLGNGSTALKICWDIDGVNLNLKDNVTGEVFNKDITTSGPGCYTVPYGLTTVIISIKYTKSPIPSVLNVSPTSLSLGANSGSFGDLNISSNVKWTVSSNVSWLSLSLLSGSNDGTVIITANSKNPTINDRSGTVTVTGGGLSKTVNITQAGSPADLTLTPSNREVTSSSGSTTFDINSNINWVVSDDANWLSVLPTSGSYNATITANYESNPSINERTAIITATGEGITRTVTVTQTGTTPVLTVSPTSLTLASTSGSNDKVSITSNISWTVTDNATWLTVSPTSGSNNGELTITATSENTSINSRGGTVIVTGNGITRAITVTQTGASPVLTVSPASLTLGSASGSNDKVSVSSNISWTVTDNATWLTVSPASGTNNGELTVTATSENTSINSRSGTIIVTGNGITRTVTVTQAGDNPVLTISPDSLLLEYNAGSFGDFSVSSNIDWIVKNTQEWITVSPTSGSNNENIRATTITDNPSTTVTRIDTITITGEGITQIVVVAQSPKIASLKVTPDSVELASDADSQDSIMITSNINWTVTYNADWLSVLPTEGFGDSTIVIIADTENPSATELREAIVTISGSGILRYINVAQSPTSAILVVNTDSIFIDSEVGSYSDFSVTSNINWSVISNNTWLSATPVSGINNSDVRITADSSNLSANERIGSVTISGAGITELVYVIQSGIQDIIPPAAPTGFEARVYNLEDGIYLSWNSNKEIDFSHYTIYKGNYDGFEPDSSNILVSTTDTSFVDKDSLEDTNYYKLTATDYTGNESDYAEAFIIVDVEDPVYRPMDYSLKQNYPNPFNPSTEIFYSIKQSGFVTLTVYNSLGQKIVDLVNDYEEAGKHKVVFDASELSSGIYFYKIQANGFVRTKKMILMK